VAWCGGGGPNLVWRAVCIVERTAGAPGICLYVYVVIAGESDRDCKRKCFRAAVRPISVLLAHNRMIANIITKKTCIVMPSMIAWC